MKKTIIIFFMLFIFINIFANEQSIELSYGFIDFNTFFLFNYLTLTFIDPPIILNFNKIEKSDTKNLNFKILVKQLWAKEWDYYLKFSIMKFNGNVSYLSSDKEYYALTTDDIIILYFSPIGIEYSFCNISILNFFFEIDFGIIYFDKYCSGFFKHGLAIGEITGNENYWPIFLDCNYALGLKINLQKTTRLTIKTGMIIPITVLISFGLEFVN
ncbi:MAG: hypothetical protein N2Z20_02840 [Elusimicrobiales bacterium]|nr:hypothetical protein [Elusimicrobiales bacterium]